MLHSLVSVPFLTDDELKRGLIKKGQKVKGKFKILSTIDYGEELIRKSINVFKISSPSFFSQIEIVVDEVLIHSSQESNSFVSEKIDGVIFLYPKEPPTLCYFIEELAHQGGHLILLAATNSPSEYFNFEQDAFTSTHNKLSTNRRSNYVILHSLFTLAMISSCLRDVIHSNVLNKDENLEALGRLIYASKRFELDAISILNSNTLNQKGLILLRAMATSVQRSIDYFKHFGLELNMQGHEYDFSVQSFMKLNRQFADS